MLRGVTLLTNTGSRCQLLVVSVLNTAIQNMWSPVVYSNKLPEFDTPINSGYNYIKQ